MTTNRHRAGGIAVCLWVLVPLWQAAIHAATNGIYRARAAELVHEVATNTVVLAVGIGPLPGPAKQVVDEDGSVCAVKCAEFKVVAALGENLRGDRLAVEYHVLLRGSTNAAWFPHVAADPHPSFVFTGVPVWDGELGVWPKEHREEGTVSGEYYIYILVLRPTKERHHDSKLPVYDYIDSALLSENRVYEDDRLRGAGGGP